MKVKVNVKSTAKVHAHCSMTGKFERAFESMEALRKCWPSAEIVCIEECDGYIKVYC